MLQYAELCYALPHYATLCMVLLYVINVGWLSDACHTLTNFCLWSVCSTWKFMVFVHAKIGQLKVKDLSQKLQGISGFIFHLQLCEGRQLKHQILLKAHTEWATIHTTIMICNGCDKVGTDSIYVGFVSSQEWETKMDHSHVPLWSIGRYWAGHWEWW